MIDEHQLISAIDIMISKLEKISFDTNSISHFQKNGVFDIAFEGIENIAEENPEIKSYLQPEYNMVKEYME
jgi:hypothetical protein